MPILPAIFFSLLLELGASIVKLVTAIYCDVNGFLRFFSGGIVASPLFVAFLLDKLAVAMQTSVCLGLPFVWFLLIVLDCAPMDTK
jgi:hypothetical protein